MGHLKELLDKEPIGHDLQESSTVFILIAVVWCGENSEDWCDGEDPVAVGKVLKVTVLLNLVAANDAAEVVAAEELLDGCESIEVTGAAECVRREFTALPLVFTHLHALVAPLWEGVCPDEVPETCLLRYLAEAVNAADVLEGAHFGADATMRAKAVSIRRIADNSTNGQRTEQTLELIVNLPVVFVKHLVVERHKLTHKACFVVPTQQIQLCGVPNLQRAQVQHNLRAEGAPVHVVPEEQVPPLDTLQVPRDLEDRQHVVELPVQVPAHHCRRLQLQQVRLLLKNTPRALDQPQRSVVCQLPLLQEMRPQ